MATLAQALRRGDRLRAERGLEKARALQPLVDAWSTSLDSGIAIARISPFLRRQRSELQRHERIRQSTDLATRNLRVIARAWSYLCDDSVPRPVAADLLGGARARRRARRAVARPTSRSNRSRAKQSGGPGRSIRPGCSGWIGRRPEADRGDAAAGVDLSPRPGCPARMRGPASTDLTLIHPPHTPLPPRVRRAARGARIDGGT